jgi:hypothetical protein
MNATSTSTPIPGSCIAKAVTAASVKDVRQAGVLVLGQELLAFGDAGFKGVHKRAEARGPN